jgi:hypothetical protein
VLKSRPPPHILQGTRPLIRTGEVGGESATGFFKTGSESEAGPLVVDFASGTGSTKSVLIFFGDGLLKFSFVSEVPEQKAASLKVSSDTELVADPFKDVPESEAGGSLDPKKLKTDGMAGGILGSVPLAA